MASFASAVISVKVSNILPAVRSVIGIVERVPVLPVLGHLLLNANDGIVSVVASKQNEQATASCPAGTPEGGCSMTVPAQRFVSILASLPSSETILLEAAGDTVRITSGSSSFTMPTFDPFTFPLLSNADEGITFSLTASVLRGILTETAFAMAQRDVRAYLVGSLFEIEKDTLNVVATDSYRLARASVKLDNLALDEETHSGIVPRSTVLQLLKVLPLTDVGVNMRLCEGSMFFKWTGTELITTLVEGKYPDYRRVIPSLESNNRSITLERSVLLNAVERASLCANADRPGMLAEISKDGILLVCRGENLDTAQIRVDCEWPHEEIKPAYNQEFFTSILSALKCGKVELRFGAPTGPLLITKEHVDPAEYAAILMPCRI